MNVICLLCDSLNRHFLNAYGNKIADTPNIDWLAKQSYVFEKHFSGSLPTMPTRRELWTGNYEFLWRPWGALEPWDDELPLKVKNHGVLPMLITDSYHLFEQGSGNYHFNFEGWEFFRGFENDPWVTDPTPMPEYRGNLKDRYVRNMRRMQTEAELPPAMTLRAVESWLQKNYTHERFMLMIDEFGPHEPFNAPEYLVRKYDPDWNGPLLFWPSYGKDLFDEAEIAHLRAQYAAHVELIDKYLGRVFETMTELDLWKNTAFVLMTDHGHFLGEHGFTGKPPCPQYDVLAHIPMMIRLPNGAEGRRVKALTANIDLYPTLLDLLEVPLEHEVHGKSLLPLLQGKRQSVRDWTLYGYYGRFVNVTDGSHTYFRAPAQEDAELYVYSLGWQFSRGLTPKIVDQMARGNLELGEFMPTVGFPVGRVPVSHRDFMKNTYESYNHLYDIDADPEQNKNLAGGEAEGAYEDLLRKALAAVDSPPEQATRLGL